jgi:hypothetical protein
MRFALVLALIPVLAACHDLHTVPSTHLAEPVHVDVPDVYVHSGSGITFAAKAGGFARTDVSRYDAEGNDVGVHYRRFGKDSVALFRTEATLFVYPSMHRADGSEQTFDEQFDGEVREIRSNRHYGGVREVRRADSDAARAGRAVHVRAAEFTYQGDEKLANQTMVTILAAYLDGPWHVTCRADFPPQVRDECLAGVEELLAALELPPTGLPPWQAAAPAK